MEAGPQAPGPGMAWPVMSCHGMAYSAGIWKLDYEECWRGDEIMDAAIHVSSQSSSTSVAWTSRLRPTLDVGSSNWQRAAESTGRRGENEGKGT